MDDIRLISMTDLAYHTKGFNFLQDKVSAKVWGELIDSDPEFAIDQNGEDGSDRFKDYVASIGYPAEKVVALQNLNKTLSREEQFGYMILPIPDQGKEVETLAAVGTLIKQVVENRVRHTLRYEEFKCLPRASGNLPCDEGKACDRCKTAEFQRLVEAQVDKEFDRQAGPSPELRLKTEAELANMLQETTEHWFKGMFGQHALDKMDKHQEADQDVKAEYDGVIDHLAAILFQYIFKAE